MTSLLAKRCVEEPSASQRPPELAMLGPPSFTLPAQQSSKKKATDELHAMSMADFQELIKKELEGAEQLLRIENDVCACAT